jgi:hypothetical protein
MDNKEFRSYTQSVINYVENGILPEDVTKRDFINRIRDLSDTQIEHLKNGIEGVLPKNPHAGVTYLLDHISSTFNWAILIGAGGGAVGYKLSENLIISMILSITTFGATFLGKLLYQAAQISDKYHAMENRAQRFLDLLEALLPRPSRTEDTSLRFLQPPKKHPSVQSILNLKDNGAVANSLAL